MGTLAVASTVTQRTLRFDSAHRSSSSVAAGGDWAGHRRAGPAQHPAHSGGRPARAAHLAAARCRLRIHRGQRQSHVAFHPYYLVWRVQTKEWLFRITKATAMRYDSKIVLANAWYVSCSVNQADN